MTRKLTYFVACSMDGFIAAPGGRIDWLFTDQDYGYAAFYSQVDTLLMGRKTYDLCMGFPEYPYPNKRAFVFSRTLESSPRQEVEITDEEPGSLVMGLKREPGGTIWLVGGFGLAKQLWHADEIDQLFVSIHPVSLGDGVPLFPKGELVPRKWRLMGSRIHATGLLQAVYDRVRDH